MLGVFRREASNISAGSFSMHGVRALLRIASPSPGCTWLFGPVSFGFPLGALAWSGLCSMHGMSGCAMLGV